MHTPPRILIVDDEPFNVEYIEQELSDKEYELLSAVNGQEALDKIRSESPDLVLLDIMMPIMDGYTVLARLKADPATRHIPVIIISASNDIQSVVRGIQKGAEDYLPKPFEPTILHARIAASLDRKRMHDQEQLYLQSLEKEMTIARDIQQEFLPTQMPLIPGWEVASYFKAAKFVAGDFYDAFLLPDGNLILILGDVCGKGVGAALFMTLFRSLLRSSITAGQTSASPAEWIHHAVASTNHYIASTHEQALVFSTVVMAALDTKTGDLRYINAGNDVAYLTRKDGSLETLPATGPVVGFNAHAVYTVGETRLESGDRLLIYTDGIPDSKNQQNEFFGYDRIESILKQSGSTSKESIDRLMSEVEHFIGDADPFDDVTLLAIRRE